MFLNTLEATRDGEFVGLCQDGEPVKSTVVRKSPSILTIRDCQAPSRRTFQPQLKWPANLTPFCLPLPSIPNNVSFHHHCTNAPQLSPTVYLVSLFIFHHEISSYMYMSPFHLFTLHRPLVHLPCPDPPLIWVSSGGEQRSHLQARHAHCILDAPTPVGGPQGWSLLEYVGI